MALLLQFFLSGLALGVSICGIHCSILLLPLVARESLNWKEGVKTGLLFGAGKVIVYGIFGGIASYSGYLVRDIIDRGTLALAGGVVLILLGAWFLFYRGRCRKFFKNGSPFLLGLVDGVFPCGPMLGFVVYLAYISRGLYFGILAGSLFGLGTITGPVLAVCGITPCLWRRLSRFSKAGLLLRLVGSAIFFLWGISLVLG